MLRSAETIRIVLVDDDEDTAALIRTLATRISGRTIEVTWSKSDAAGLREALQGRHDICLAGHNENGSDGIAFTKRATASGCAIPIIVLSNCPDDAVDNLALEAGASFLLEKDTICSSTLRRAMCYALERQRLTRDGQRRQAQLAQANAELEREVCERKRAESELERSNADLELFAYAASHDLQEPLRAISSYLRLLDNRLADELRGECREFLEFAVDGAKRMSQLIGDLLEYSRVSTNAEPMVPTSCADALAEALVNLKPAIDESHATILIDDLPTIKGDSAQITRLLQNLVSNALKFTDATPPKVRISSELTPEGWVISVQDNGIGIDPKFTQTVFGIFERLHTREQFDGTGIGLAMCRRIVERHGGRIWVRSTQGEGSTFSFVLPQLEESLMLAA